VYCRYVCWLVCVCVCVLWGVCVFRSDLGGWLGWGGVGGEVWGGVGGGGWVVGCGGGGGGGGGGAWAPAFSWFPCTPLVVYPFTPILLLVYHSTALVCNVFMHRGFTYYIGNNNT